MPVFMIIKKYFSLKLFAALIIGLSLSFSQPTAVVAQEEILSEVTAKSAILIEAYTGRVLYEKDAETRRYPASTTKIMTLITALEYGNLEDIVTVSKNAASTEGSSLDLLEGDRLKMLDMLYGVIMVSGNDATVAVAEHISGSVENFASLMTKKAHAIGALDTNFINSSGLPDVRHYSTAHDLARMAAYGYKNPLFSHIVSTKDKTISQARFLDREQREIQSENKILLFYDGGNGVKTGYTRAAGRCLVAGAKRGDMQLIAVVLDSKDIWADSRIILDYGFEEAKMVNVIKRGDILKTLKVKEGKASHIQLVSNLDINVPLFKTDDESFTTVINTPEKVAAPILSGQKIGTVKVLYQNHEIATADLIVEQGTERKSLFNLLWSSVLDLFSSLAKSA